VLNLTFDFGGPEAPAGARPKAPAALAAEAEADSKAAAAAGSPKKANKRRRKRGRRLTGHHMMTECMGLSHLLLLLTI
jgi:hypothetical protein